MQLSKAKRLVIKIESSTIIGEDGHVRKSWLSAMMEDIAAIRERGTQVIIVYRRGGAGAQGSLSWTEVVYGWKKKYRPPPPVARILLMQAWREGLGEAQFYGSANPAYD